jgi:PAS domain-containing protein
VQSVRTDRDGLRVDVLDADGRPRWIRFGATDRETDERRRRQLTAWLARGTPLAYVVSGDTGRLLDEEDAFRAAFGYEDPWVP